MDEAEPNETYGQKTAFAIELSSVSMNYPLMV